MRELLRESRRWHGVADDARSDGGLRPGRARSTESRRTRSTSRRASVSRAARRARRRASALAFAVESPAPPGATLRILVTARRAAERRPLARAGRLPSPRSPRSLRGRDRWGSGPSLSNSLDREQARGRRSSVCSPIRRTSGVSGTNTGRSSSDARRRFSSSRGSKAPSGRTYEAWVIKDNKPVRAGTFTGGRTTTVIPLERNVPSGSIVAVTLERKPGADAPTGKILLQSESA